MICYRTFRNSDPPSLAEIWRAQPRERALAQPGAVDVLELLVLAKPYFDNAGLIVATDDDQPVGFAHAGFGPTDDEHGLSCQLGTTYLVMVRPNYQRRGIGRQLLANAEQYLLGRGAKVLYGGGIFPLNAFYLGLYGGSELPGVLDTVPRAQHLFETSGYRAIDHVLVWQRSLAGFRPAVDRQQMHVRRRCLFQVTEDPPARTWWDACTYGPFQRIRFELLDRQTGGLLGNLVAWNIEPLGSAWGVHAAGITEFAVNLQQRRQGVGSFLLGEALRHLQLNGFTRVEVQTMQHNEAARGLYGKLGFELVDQGAVFRKESTT
ncbi:MAG TPA: GNAT family N-acetyltransferase [Pirellulales bacterium]|nr:GNAT family N-acetyltransferase [Pirellulales bacterium]